MLNPVEKEQLKDQIAANEQHLNNIADLLSSSSIQTKEDIAIAQGIEEALKIYQEVNLNMSFALSCYEKTETELLEKLKHIHWEGDN